MTNYTKADLEAVNAPVERAARPDLISQTTAVEQARAVAEVEAAVVVAQRVPRDMGQVEADMRDACGRLGLATRAFYQVPNRGNGPSVHLARELARIFGNMQNGVHELRRDDAAGMSEIQAFAWDVEKNSRATRTFQVPHARMKGRERQKLTDLGDVYLNNQNIGARAVRECIFTVLPTWYTDLAQEICQNTLERGEGKPLTQRITEMVDAFGAMNVSVAQLETKLARKRSAWQPGDIAQMTITYQSLRRRETTVDDEFPSARVTAGEIGQNFSQKEAPAPQTDQEPEGWQEPVADDAKTT